ncbi:stearoyl-[acyl-carrier-protein] 9-desaturase 6, chloroplastic-like [Andrographis paniculata]|uniref:stearoyl-[acyl-carrier-protein] 9-desaturase 6, chloroplastic-like n=1 Tax=Andrographis paniculata TaxID=175694 RepID=UPI0021E94457|nr:stearoyl-[acyl-carrier-protein] 9-desaturase 6, chloroplastic-like [Andrographis paniculata]
MISSSNRSSLAQEKLELFKSLEPWVSTEILPLLSDAEKCWQPSEFLPDVTLPVADFAEQVRDLQARTAGLADEYFVVLVGDMITEDAVSTYQTVLNTWDGVRDQSAASPSPWAVWIRAWSAEENRHGDLLRTFLYLSGKVDMLMLERTVQCLIRSGMDGGFENNPYLGFVYVAFQERATFITHGNTARLAKKGGDPILAIICGTISADEKRHEYAYTKIVEKLLEVDPNETIIAIGKMMRRGITMPGALMYDGCDPNLFEHYSTVAQAIGVYTTKDYVDILDFFIKRWRLEKLHGLNGEARREQEFVCRLPDRLRKFNDQVGERAKRQLQEHKLKFSWIFNKYVTI